MKKKLPILRTDEEAEAFLEQDLSEYDFSQFKPVRFVFEPKTENISLRLPTDLMEAVRLLAETEGISEQAFFRAALEQAVVEKNRA